VIDALCEAFARDEMALEDFERRIEAAHRTETAAELDALLADLPSAGVPAPTAGATPSQIARQVVGRVQGAVGGPTRGRELVMGVMGGAARRGRWTPARRITVVGIMGGAELDFREAVLPPGVTEVHAFAFWGGVEILVPPHVRLESSGIGIMGGFETRDQAESSRAPDDPAVPTLRITGVAIMGGVEVTVRYPGESGREAKKRLREERRRRLPPDRGEGGRG
jgi:hypothetical protein